MQKKNYVQEILDIIHSGLPQAELAEKLSDYHENDLADALTALTPEERQKVYTTLGVDTVAEIFSYLDDAEPYLKELDPERAARVISHMDSDDAVDALVKDDDDWQSCVFKLHVRAEYGGFQWIFGNFFDGEVFEFSLIQVFLEAFCFFVHFDSLFLNQ